MRWNMCLIRSEPTREREFGRKNPIGKAKNSFWRNFISSTICSPLEGRKRRKCPIRMSSMLLGWNKMQITMIYGSKLWRNFLWIKTELLRWKNKKMHLKTKAIKNWSRRSIKFWARLRSIKKKLSKLTNRFMKRKVRNRMMIKKRGKWMRDRSLQNMSLWLIKKWKRKQPRNINGQLKTPAIFQISTASFRVKNLQKNILSNWMSSKKDQFCIYKRNKAYL